MKRFGAFSRGSWLKPLVNVLLALVLVFSASPLIAPGARAQTLQTTAPPAKAQTAPVASASTAATTTVVVTPDQDTEVKSPSEKITLLVPAGAVSAPTKIEFAEYVPPGSTGTKILHLFELKAFLESSGEEVTQFSKDLTTPSGMTPVSWQGWTWTPYGSTI